MELISVIVPVYKVEEYLDKCIQSIVDQTYTNLEIILVDDGSPDRCGEMCDAWAKKDGRIRVRHQSNGGLSDARNAGMEIAVGTYIAFVDSDDWIAPDFIQSMYDAIRQSGAQIAGCDIQFVFPDEAIDLRQEAGKVKICTTEEAITDILQYRGFRAVAWNKLYHRELLEGERYPVGKHHEDEFFTYRIIGKADKLVYVDKPMYFYLQRPGSIMYSFTIKRLDALDAYLERLEYLKERYPKLYYADKLSFCIACAVFYAQAQKIKEPSAAAIKRKIKRLRRKVKISRKETKELTVKQKLYVIGTAACIGLFCSILNLRKQGAVMGDLCKRIRNRIVMTAKSFRSDLHFSLYFAFLRLGSELGGRLHMRKLSRIATEKKNRWTDNYLRKQLEPVYNQFENDHDIGHYEPNAPIWVCWWDGEDAAPHLVKNCIQSIRKNAGGHQVNLLTKNNYRDYLDIPEFILDRVENEDMCLAHLSDYIRLALLAKYGGLWLDATIFCAYPLSEEMFRLPLFTCKGRTVDVDYYSDYKWTVFCIGGYRGNVFFRALQALLEDYWKSNRLAIDYLFLDHTIKLLCSTHETCGKLIDDLQENNPRRDDLQAAMNAALPASQINQIIQPDTVFYKLSWREKYKTRTENGTQSVYGAFLKGLNRE